MLFALLCAICADPLLVEQYPRQQPPSAVGVRPAREGCGACIPLAAAKPQPPPLRSRNLRCHGISCLEGGASSEKVHAARRQHAHGRPRATPSSASATQRPLCNACSPLAGSSHTSGDNVSALQRLIPASWLERRLPDSTIAVAEYTADVVWLEQYYAQPILSSTRTLPGPSSALAA